MLCLLNQERAFFCVRRRDDELRYIGDLPFFGIRSKQRNRKTERSSHTVYIMCHVMKSYFVLAIMFHFFPKLEDRMHENLGQINHNETNKIWLKLLFKEMVNRRNLEMGIFKKIKGK